MMVLGLIIRLALVEGITRLARIRSPAKLRRRIRGLTRRLIPRLLNGILIDDDGVLLLRLRVDIHADFLGEVALGAAAGEFQAVRVAVDGREAACDDAGHGGAGEGGVGPRSASPAPPC